jgi:uncharacterized membrane protein YvbJ
MSRFCDYCGCDYVEDWEDDCPECGSKVPLPQRCPYCGADMYPSYYNICHMCGHDVTKFWEEMTREK